MAQQQADRSCGQQPVGDTPEDPFAHPRMALAPGDDQSRLVLGSIF